MKTQMRTHKVETGTEIIAGPNAAHAEQRMLVKLASLDRFGVAFLRLALAIVLLWIGGLKFASYEADSIVPLIANHPALKILYHFRAPEYQSYMNREGEFIPEHRNWQVQNGTYRVSYRLGIVIISLGLLIALHPTFPIAAVLGSSSLILMALTTLSFLVTTPEAWVPALGDAAHGFPFLSGVGRLIIKDVIMLGAAMVTLADSAKASLRRLANVHS
ncbi:MAG: YkgB family protein [Acidobacteriaceae bacterium]|nr:YkgB family protein [Acidobacteriaceae bacterium]